MRGVVSAFRALRFPGSVAARWAAAGLALLVFWGLPWLAGALAQGTAGRAGVTAKAGGSSEAEKIPPPEDVDLRTEDGVRLRATYYPGTRGKETAPVILLHMWKGSRNDYSELAIHLQSLGHAVIVPDLRGHGESTRVEGSGKALDAATLPPQAFAAMVEDDVESVKSFLLAKNNAGEVNIEKLCVVGAEMGAVVALDWARLDWSWPPLATGKQGQDVKALVLISSPWSFRGLNVKEAMADPKVRSELSIMLLAGKEKAKDVQDAKRLYNIFIRYHPEPPREKAAQLQNLFYRELDTSLQGTKMLGVGSLEVPRWIAAFIDLRLVKQPYPWKDRSKPL